MKTDHLIAALAADTTPEPPVASRGWLLLPALVTSLVVLVWSICMRPDLMAAVGAPLVALKTLLPIALAALAATVALRLLRPGGRVGRVARASWGAPGIVVLAMLYALAGNDPSAWSMLATGKTVTKCLVMIPALAVPPLLAAFVIARRGAPTDPARTGAMLGLMAGALSTAIYSLHCNEDSPLFYGIWYVLGILAVTGAGTLLGPRLLRW